ncbi:hypothetical protein DPMN_134515 [Dreissena polymorpha]|uniref:Secreted protein n=1 Tax=Dreissena polymorpha TaxID=45954 RepID=A0A9D4FWC3_DREPO|nr:hypothetical protein DPMN_134515 [Dreissena polymorpha]
MVICRWLCIVCGVLLCICLELKRRSLSVIYVRRSVVEGCISLPFPERITRRPRTSAPTPSEPEPWVRSCGAGVFCALETATR